MVGRKINQGGYPVPGLPGPEGPPGPPGPPGSIGAGDLVSKINFNISQYQLFANGELGWDPTKQALTYGLANGAGKLNIGQAEIAYVSNMSGVTIQRGQMVESVGTNGADISVALAPAYVATYWTADRVIGMALENISHTGSGYVLVRGLIENIDTSMFLPNATLYHGLVDPGSVVDSDGVRASTEAIVGVVIRSHATLGAIYINQHTGISRLDTLYDVQIVDWAPNQVLAIEARGADYGWHNTSDLTLTSLRIEGDSAPLEFRADLVGLAGGGLTRQYLSGTGTFVYEINKSTPTPWTDSLVAYTIPVDGHMRVVDKMFIQNLGTYGTDSGDGSLSITGDRHAVINLDSLSSNSQCQLNFGVSGDYYGKIVYGNTTHAGDANSMVFYTAATEAFRINGSQQVSGLKVTELNSGPLAGFRNRIINGGFDVWQRGTSVSSGVGTYTADNFRSYTLGANLTFSRDLTFSTPCLLITGAASNTICNVGFPIEADNIDDLAGTQVTISYEIYSSTVRAVGLGTVYFNTRNSGMGASTNDYSNTSMLTTVINTWQKVTYTYTLHANFKNGGYIDLLIGAVTAGQTVRIRNVQLEPGSVATPFESRPYSVELALCQRYYQRLTPDATGNRQIHGNATSTTTAHFMYNFPVKLRIPPTALEQSGVATDYSIATQGTTVNCSSVPTFSSSTVDASLTNYTTASGLTAGYACLTRSNNGSAGFLAWSAEL